MNGLPPDLLDNRRAGALAVAKRLALAAVPCWLTLLFVTETGVPPVLRAMVAIVAVVSIVYPTEGLCIVAAAVPLGDLIAIALESTPVRLTEALVVAFLAGWLLSPGRRTNRGPAPTGMVRDSALAFAVLILSSVAAVVLQMKAYAPTMWRARFRERSSNISPPAPTCSARLPDSA